MEFRIKADAIFEAENIDDAFLKLSEHFKEIEEKGNDAAEDFLKSGHILIEKAET